MSSVPLDACHIRWAGNEETSPDVCGNSWNTWQLGECRQHIFGDSPKTVGWAVLFNCCVEYCNYKSVSQILREKKKTMYRGVGDYFMSVDGLKVEEINLWIGSLISVLFPLHFKLLIWWLGLQVSLIFCLFSPLALIAFGFPKDSLWQNWLFCPQQ